MSSRASRVEKRCVFVTRKIIKTKLTFYFRNTQKHLVNFLVKSGGKELRRSAKNRSKEGGIFPTRGAACNECRFVDRDSYGCITDFLHSRKKKKVHRHGISHSFQDITDSSW
jgi:hypothetical protein